MVWAIVASLIASATALFIAFKAYPYQKAKDRHFKLGEERRQAYRRFVEAVLTQRDVLIKSKSELDQYERVNISIFGEVSFRLALENSLLSLCADSDVIDKSGEIVGALEKNYRRLQAACHDDTKLIHSGDDVKNIFTDLTNGSVIAMSEALEETLTLMRNKEFSSAKGDIGTLKFAGPKP